MAQQFQNDQNPSPPEIPPPPPRPVDAHKGTFGTVIVVGGSVTMPGAAAITARAALRSGVGLVKIAADLDVLSVALTIEPGATGIALPDNPHAQYHAIDRADPDGLAVLAVGPGLGLSDAAAQLLEQLLCGPRPVVLDADGLNLLAQSTQRHPVTGSALILTPHPGEYRRLAQRLRLDHDPTDPDQRPAAAVALAQAHHAVVILKGRRSVITDAVHTTINHTGNPALATAGSGDVLTGLIAALLAGGNTPLDAAICAAHVHGRAADLWSQSHHGQRGMLARELADLLPVTLAEVEGGGGK